MDPPGAWINIEPGRSGKWGDNDIFGCLIWGPPFWTPKNDVIGPLAGPSRFKNEPCPQGIHRTLRPLSLPWGYGPTCFLSLDQGELEGDLTSWGAQKVPILASREYGEFEKWVKLAL